MGASLSPSEIIQWYLDAGVDEAIGEAPVDRFQEQPRKKPASTPPPAFLQNPCDLPAAAATPAALRAVT